jgi:hypothetical protein
MDGYYRISWRGDRIVCAWSNWHGYRSDGCRHSHSRFMRAMLMDLKTVFLDKENKRLIVKGAESIPYAEVREILRPWTPPYIATVTLGKRYSFGNTFTFVPDGHPLFWEDYDEELNVKIRR